MKIMCITAFRKNETKLIISKKILSKNRCCLNEIMAAVIFFLLSFVSISSHAGKVVHDFQGAELHAQKNQNKNQNNKIIPSIIDIRTTQDPLITAAVLSTESLSGFKDAYRHAKPFDAYLLFTTPHLTKSTVQLAVAATAADASVATRPLITLGGYSSSGQTVQDNLVAFEDGAFTGHKAIAGLAGSSNMLPENSIHLPRNWRTTNEVTNIGPIKTQRNTLKTAGHVTLGESVAAALSDFSFIGSDELSRSTPNNHSIYKSISSAKNIDFIDSSKIDSETIESMRNSLQIGPANKTSDGVSLLVGAQTSMNMVASSFEATGQRASSFVSATTKTIVNEDNTVEIGDGSHLKSTIIAGLTKINLVAGHVRSAVEPELVDRHVMLREVDVANDHNKIRLKSASVADGINLSSQIKKSFIESNPNNRSADILVGGSVDFYGESGGLFVNRPFDQRSLPKYVNHESDVALKNVNLHANNNEIKNSEISQTKGTVTGGKVFAHMVVGQKGYKQDANQLIHVDDVSSGFKIYNTTLESNENKIILSKDSEHAGDIFGGSVTLKTELGFPEGSVNAQYRFKKPIELSFKNTLISASENNLHINGVVQSGAVVGGSINLEVGDHQRLRVSSKSADDTAPDLNIQSIRNKVFIDFDGIIKDSKSSIYGGYLNDRSTRDVFKNQWVGGKNIKYDLFTGNTLEIAAKSVSVDTLANFEKYNFIIHPELANQSAAQLEANSIYFGTGGAVVGSSINDRKNSIVNVIGIHPGKQLHVNDQFVLMRALKTMDGEVENSGKESELLYQKFDVKKGMSYYYKIITEQNIKNKTVIAKVIGKKDERSLTQDDQNKIENKFFSNKIADLEEKLKSFETKNNVDEIIKKQAEEFLKKEQEQKNSYLNSIKSLSDEHQLVLGKLQAKSTEREAALALLTQKAESAKQQLAVASDDLNKLQTEFKNHQTALKSVQQELVDTKAKTVAEVDSLQRDKANLDHAIQAKETALVQQQHEVARLSAHAHELEAEQQTLKDRLAAQTAVVAEKDQATQGLSQQLRDKALSLEKKDGEIGDLNTALAALRANAALTSSALQSAKAQADTTKQQLAAANDDLSRLQTEFKSHQIALKKVQQELADTKTKTVAQVDALQRDKATVDQEMQSKETALTQQQQEVARLSSHVRELEAEQGALKDLLATQTAMATEKDQAAQSLNQQLRDKALSLSKKDGEIGDLQSALATLRASAALTSTALQTAQVQAETTQQQLAATNADLSQLKTAYESERTASAQEMREFNDSNQKKDMEILALQLDKDTLTDLIESKEKLLNEPNEKLKGLNQRVLELTSKRDALEASLAEKEAQIAANEADLQTLNDEHQKLLAREDARKSLHAELNELLQKAVAQDPLLHNTEDAAIVNPQLQSLSEGNLSSLMLVTRAGDIVAEALYPTLEMQNRDQGLNLFATSSTGFNQYGTSAAIRSRDLTLTAGLSLRQPGGIAAVFVEGGWSDYDTHNDFVTQGKVDAKGHNSYIGFGVYGRLENESHLGPYVDASLRLGRLNTQYKSEDLRNPLTGGAASYGLQRPYLSSHAGFGYVIPLNSKMQLDVNTQYLWSLVDGQDTAVADEPIQFKGLESQRLRVGATLSHQYGDELILKAGLGYEYEFDGQARATTYDTDAIAVPSLRGGTALIKLGATFQPANDPNLALRFDLSAYAGQHTGARADLRLTYLF